MLREEGTIKRFEFQLSASDCFVALGQLRRQVFSEAGEGARVLRAAKLLRGFWDHQVSLSYLGSLLKEHTSFLKVSKVKRMFYIFVLDCFPPFTESLLLFSVLVVLWLTATCKTKHRRLVNRNFWIDQRWEKENVNFFNHGKALNILHSN